VDTQTVHGHTFIPNHPMHGIGRNNTLSRIQLCNILTVAYHVWYH